MKLKYNPTCIIFDLTLKCNQECYFCWRSDRELVKQKTKEADFLTMPFDMFKHIMDHCSDLEDITRVNLCGPLGEPLLDENIVDKFFYAKEVYKKSQNKDVFTTINTNGFLLDKYDPEKLLNAIDCLNVSVDSVDPETYKQIHGKDQLEKVIENIIHLHQKKKEKKLPGIVSVRFTEGEKNKGQRKRFEKFFRDKVDRVFSKSIHSFIDVFPVSDNDTALLCNQPYGSLNFNYRGQLTTCCINHKLEPEFGMVGEDGSIKELWEGEKFEAWREARHEGICNGCSGLGPAQHKRNLYQQWQFQKKIKYVKKHGEKAYFLQNQTGPIESD